MAAVARLAHNPPSMRASIAALLALFAFPALAASRVTLVAPAAGMVLEGGSTAVVAWEGTLASHAEEWEAFLSVDGGRYYAVRITPHLDAQIRSFRFTVPNVAAHDARILIRAGNETIEEAIAIPASFSIRASRLSLTVLPALAGAAGRETGGAEAALPGDVPVVAWVAGDRQGRGLANRVRHDRESVGSVAGATLHDCSDCMAGGQQPFVTAYSRSSGSPRRSRRERPSTIIALARDLLLQTSRLNI
jgi:hypothetical protein